VKLGKTESDTCTILSEAYGGEAMKSQVFLSGINDSESMNVEITNEGNVHNFFDNEVIIHFEFI